MSGQENHHEQEEKMVEHKTEEEYWNLQENAVQQMVENPREVLKEYFGSPDPMPIRCIDERVYVNGHPVHGIAVPGSGILFTPEQQEEFLRNLKRSGIKVTTVTRHDGCGAEGLSGLPETEISKIDAALAGKLEVPTTMAPMMSDVHGHVARGAILSYSQNFLAAKIQNGLRPFLISGWASPTAMKDTELAVQIAFGSHGYGADRFGDGKLPFYATIVGRQDVPELRWEAKAEELREVLAKMDQSKILINGFDI